VRLFFAVWPAPRERKQLAALAHKLAHLSHGRASGLDNLHLTLAFLGDVDDSLLPALHTLGASLSRLPIGEMPLTHTGSWPNGIVWAAPDTTPPELAQLVAELNAGIAALGLPVEKRRYAPHLTLVRRAQRPLATRALHPIPWVLDHLALVASELDASGARYTTLARWPLGISASQP
jgi:2'-5' RNA ligase